MMRRAVIGALLAGLVLTGCGGDGSTADRAEAESLPAVTLSTGQELLLASAGRTIEAGTSRVAIDVTVTGNPELPEGASLMVGQGAFDHRARTGHLDVRLLPSLIPDAPPMEMLFVGDVLYLRAPDMGLPTPWLKIDMVAAAQLTGVDVGGLDQLQGSDPASTLQFLKGAADDVIEVGREVIRGVEATHHRGTLHLERALEQVPAEQRAGVKAAMDQLGMTTFVADVWVDDDGLLRRMVYNLDAARMSVGNGEATLVGIMRVSMDLFEFGAVVEVVPPPADQTTDLIEMATAQ